MTSTTPPTAAPPDDPGTVVILGAPAGAPACVAYAIHPTPAQLTTARHMPDATLTPRLAGAPYAVLGLAVDAGRWRAKRDPYAAAVGHVCARCATPLILTDGAWVSKDYITTAGGLSFCPPDPDATRAGDHQPRKGPLR